MKVRFFKKRLPSYKKYIEIKEVENIIEDKVVEKVEISTEKENIKNVKSKNKSNKKSIENMDTINKIKEAEAISNEMEREVKIIKADKGLIERTESSKIILTEDNRQILVD